MGASVLAKPKPVSADQAAVAAIVEQIYADYSKPMQGATDDISQEPADSLESELQKEKLLYTLSLRSLLDRWNPIAHGDELYAMNSFDWYCQCQDFDPKTAKLISQKTTIRGKDAIDVKTRFSRGWGDNKGVPMVIKFKREGAAWKIDELIMDKNMSLRAGLLDDIKEAAKAATP
jgi:Protein of unknown function (DUF3828)